MKTLLILLISTLTAMSALPLGTLTINNGSQPGKFPVIDPSGWPAGYNNVGFAITCPDVAGSIVGFFATGEPEGIEQGTIVLLSGNHGTTYYTEQDLALPDWVNGWRANGWRVIQIRWKSNWWQSSVGDAAGIFRLGCRPATALSYLNSIYGPLRVHGNSAGGSQIGYALAFYGADDLISHAVLSGGPPHSDLPAVTIGEDESLWFSDNKLKLLDKAWGYWTGGPAVAHDPNWEPEWQAHSIAYGGNDYGHPNTAISFIQGEQDPDMMTIGGEYHTALSAENTVAWSVIPSTGHGVYETAAGRAAIESALLAP